MTFDVLTTKLIKRSSLLDCYVMLSSKYKRFLTFQRNIMPPSLWSISQQAVILDVLDPEDGSTMLL